MKLLRLTCAFALCLVMAQAQAKVITLGMAGNLQSELQKYELVIVKFSATWCGPCKSLANTIHNIEKEFPDVTIIDVDVDKHQSISKHIRNLPTMEFYIKGKKVATVSGGQDAGSMRALIKKNLKTNPACAAPQKK